MHFLLLLDVRRRSLVNSLRGFQMSEIPSAVTAVCVFGGFAAGMFFLSRAVSLYLIEVAHIGLFLLHRFVGMVLYVLFITVNIGNLIVSYATLYRSDEVDFLISLPVKPQDIFVVKFLDNFFTSSSTLVLMGLAALFGYASALHLGWGSIFVITIFINVPLLLLSGVLAVLLLVLAVAAAGKIGLRRIVIAAVLLYLGMTFAYFQVSNPVKLVAEVMKHYPYVNRYFGELDSPAVQFLPTHWAAEFLYWTAAGIPGKGMPSLVSLCMVSAIAAACTWFVGERLFYRSWIVAGEAMSLRQARADRQHSAWVSFTRRTLGNPVADVFVKRDFLMFFRDPTQWIHAIVLCILLAVFLVSLAGFELPPGQPIYRAFAFLIMLLFNSFLLAAIALRFVFPAISLEGNAFWLVRSAPVGLRTLYLSKLAVAIGLILLLSQLLAGVTAAIARQGIGAAVTASVVLGCTSVTMSALHLAAGAEYVMFHERNPIRIASSRGATMTFLTSIVYLASVTGVLFVPIFRYNLELLNGGETSAAPFIPVLSGIVAASLIISTLATIAGLRAIGKDFS